MNISGPDFFDYFCDNQCYLCRNGLISSFYLLLNILALADLILDLLFQGL